MVSLSRLARLLRHEAFLGVYLGVLLLGVRQLSPSFYWGFLLGMANALLALLLLFQYVLLGRIKNKYPKCQSVFEYASLEVDSLVKEPSGEEIRQQMKKKKYFINQFSCEDQLHSLQQKVLPEEQSGVRTEKIDYSAINRHPLRQGLAARDGQIRLDKLEHSYFQNIFQSHVAFFSEVHKSENDQGEQLQSFGRSTILSYTYESVVFKDDVVCQRVSPDSLSPLQRRLFPEGELTLPSFKALRTAVHKMGESQHLLSNFLQQSSVVMLQQYTDQIGRDFMALKKQRKVAKEQLQDTQSKYNKAHKAHLDQERLSKQVVEEFNEARKKRVDPQQLIKNELEARLNVQLLGTLKTQCLEKSDKLADVMHKASAMNSAVRLLKSKVAREFQQVIRTVVRGSVQAYANQVDDNRAVLRVLLSAESGQSVNMSGIENSMDNTYDLRLLDSAEYQKRPLMDVSNQSVQWSEESFNLSTFCILPEDFDSLNVNSQTVIQEHLELFARLERQFEQQSQKVSYALKYNAEMQEQFDNYLKILSSSCEKQRRLITKFNGKINKIVSTFQNHFSAYLDVKERTVVDLRQVLERVGDSVRNFEKSFRKESGVQNKYNFEPYKQYLQSHKKKSHKIYRDLNRDRNVQTFRMKYQFLFKYNQFQSLVHCFQKENRRLLGEFKLSMVVAQLSQCISHQELIESYLESFEQETTHHEKDDSLLQIPSESSILCESRQTQQVRRVQPSPQNVTKSMFPHSIDKNIANSTHVFMTQLFQAYASEWKHNSVFQRKIEKKLTHSFNQKRSANLSEIKVSHFKIHDDFEPQFSEVSPLPAAKDEFLWDFQLKFRGHIYFQIGTTINFTWPVANSLQVNVHVIIKSIYGRLRICFTHLANGKSWFSFVNDPVIEIQINPLVGKSQYNIGNLPQIQELINEMILSKIRKMTYPNRKTLKVPLSHSAKSQMPPLEPLPQELDLSSIRKESMSHRQEFF